MKKIILLISILVSTLAFGQEEVPYNVLGTWYNMEGELLTISRNLDEVVFVRKSKLKILATGDLSINKGELHITRYDTKDEYNLVYGITGSTLVITKPNSVEAWIWTKIQ